MQRACKRYGCTERVFEPHSAFYCKQHLGCVCAKCPEPTAKMARVKRGENVHQDQCYWMLCDEHEKARRTKTV